MMMEQKPLCGFLNVLKPPGMSSAAVVGLVRRLLDGEKVGHAGTLDPEAAGVLPLMVGKAARLFDYMQDKEKAYVAEIAFGAATDTQDAQGQVLETGESYPDEATLRQTLKRFEGEQMQTPPMFSALKRDGQCLYQLARKGQTVEIPERQVTVHSLALNAMTENHGAIVAVRCSKGFYVRTLCRDIGTAVGCPAHMRFLLRTQSGVFTLGTALTIEEMQAAKENGTLKDKLLPPETALAHLPVCDLPGGLEKPLRNGGKLLWSRFGALHGTAAVDGKPACIRLDGRIQAIVERHGELVKVRTWLGD
ncbi:MAG: tRNA pseudouridine(55) synthase TruB [Clostridiales bacterium]|nr:tRNA pseudouridine(55) synthase TruB [Clostridiales bacterium]